MVSGKSKILICVVIFMTVCCMCFGNEYIDTMCGIWVDSQKPDYALALQKVSETQYFVSYVRMIRGNPVLSLADIGTVVSDNMIHLTKGESDFYVYMDYERDSLYLLWNYTVPNSIYEDVELKRVNVLFAKQ